MTAKKKADIIGKKGGITVEYKETPKITKTIKFEKDLVEKITAMGETAERDFSSQVRFMLKEYIRIKEEK